MKKITAFFMAFLPIFVVILLFMTGMLIKNIVTIPVTSVQLSNNSIEIKKEDETSPTFDLDAHVLPLNATNPDIYWTSSDNNIATVDKNTGVVTAVSYGEAKIYATSADNQTISSTCSVEVWDDKIHGIAVANQEAAEYIGLNQNIDLDATPVPKQRIKGNPALKFESSNSDIVSVSPDGVITGKATGDATISITCVDPQFESIDKEVQVHVGNGVGSISFKDSSVSTIKDNEYDLFSDLVIWPQQSQDEQKYVTVDDFEFTSNNNVIATVNEKGLVHFNQPEEATFTATYKRNKQIKTTKTLKSSGGVFNDVSFNRYNFVDDLQNYKNESFIDETKLYATVYPQSINPQIGFKVESSNQNVVKAIFDNGKYKYQVVGAGQTTLIASILAEDGSTIKDDRCTINITDKSGKIFLEDTVEVNDSTSYWLRRNVNTNVLNNEHESINWQYDASDTFDVDLENEIVHFKKPGSALISDDNGNSFTITCGYTNQEQLDVVQETYHLQAGKRYVFKDETSTWIPTFSLTSSFDINEDNSFIARSGCYDKEVTISNGQITKNIKVIVQENVYDIKYDHTYLPNLVTAEYLGIDVPALVKPKIIPSTATNEEGIKYVPSYTYKPHHDYTTIILFDVIEFIDADTVDITVQADTIVRQFTIKSTWGMPSKFNLFSDETYTTPIQSGQHISLTNGTSKTFYVSNSNFVRSLSAAEIASGIKITTLNGKSIVTSLVDYWIDEVWITLNARGCGNETVLIETLGFKFILYIDVSLEINDFDIAVNWQKLTSEGHNTIVTYTNNFKADILLNSAIVADQEYTYSLNGTSPVTVVDNQIDFSSKTLDSNNTLVLSTSNGKYTEEFNIIKKDPTELGFSLQNELANGYIYLPAGYITTTLTIIPNGIVDPEIYQNFTISFADSDITHERFENKFYIEGIDDPSDEDPGYDSDFKITYFSTEKNYHLSRETITKILFPGHDNTDRNDQKGLQQVHVFGNETLQNPDEGCVNYYKLPIEIYDYKHELIKDEEAKKEAWQKLTYTTDDQTKVTYGDKDQYNETGYLKVEFDPNKAYTPEEMYNDAFASGSKHNILLTVSTPSTFVKRSYEFVTVEGINTYHQEAFKEQDNANYVLQTNFGPKEDESTALLDYVHSKKEFLIGSLYGNGHTINFDKFSMSYFPEKKRNNILFGSSFNANIILCNEENRNNCLPAYASREGEEFINYVAYNIVSNGYIGIHIRNTSNKTYVRNCLLYNHKFVGLNINGNFQIKTTCYAQDCIFFNCGPISISCTSEGNLYLKGFFDSYNFHSKETLSNIGGYDFSFLWEDFKHFAYEAHVMHINLPDGMDRLNSTMFASLENGVFLWNDRDKKYDLAGETGNEWTISNWVTWLDVKLAGVGVVLWSSLNNEYDPNAPSYFDEFDQNGAIRWDFMNSQIIKILRIKTNITIYPY